MASLLPLLQDLLPMIMPSSVHVVKGSDLSETTRDPPDKPPSVTSSDAIVNKTDRMCASIMTIKPESSSTVRHHGEQDAIIYVASGKGALLTSPEDEEGEPKRRGLSQGDFAFVPCWTEHRAVNESDEDLVWIIIRSGPRPVEVGLTGWGGSEAETDEEG